MRKRKPLTLVDVVKRNPEGLRKMGELFNRQEEERSKLSREFLDGLVDLMDRGQLTKEATVGDKKPKGMVMVPSFDNVLVKRDEAADWSTGVGGGKGRILMPDTAKEKPKRGIVVAVGPGRWVKEGTWVEPPCKAGDIVYVRHWNGADVSIDGVAHEIFNAAEIIGVQTDDPAVIAKAYGTAASRRSLEPIPFGKGKA